LTTNLALRKRRVVRWWTEWCPGRAGGGARSYSKRSNVKRVLRKRVDCGGKKTKRKMT
jgi:hypothetical protein